MTSFVAALQRTIKAEVILGHPLQNRCRAAERHETDEATSTLTNTGSGFSVWRETPQLKRQPGTESHEVFLPVSHPGGWGWSSAVVRRGSTRSRGCPWPPYRIRTREPSIFSTHHCRRTRRAFPLQADRKINLKTRSYSFHASWQGVTVIAVGLNELPGDILSDLHLLGDRPALCHQPRKII